MAWRPVGAEASARNRNRARRQPARWEGLAVVTVSLVLLCCLHSLFPQNFYFLLWFDLNVGWSLTDCVVPDCMVIFKVEAQI